MRYTQLLTLAAFAGVSGTALAAQSVSIGGGASGVYRIATSGSDNRAALGVSTTATGTLRDTLGLLITSITRGSPAEKAGLEEGNRIASINGISLRVNKADAEDAEMSNALSRRLTREMGKVKPGDEVELQVYRDGRTGTMRIKTADADSLFRRTEVMRRSKVEMEERPVLGFSLGSTGSRRDTLGVLVMSVSDSTPAAGAGIEEGNRIAAINGVNLRVAREDAGDRQLSSSKVQRLHREISQLKPGENVTLRVYSNGQFRDVTMRVAKASEVPKSSRGGFTIFGGEGFNFAPMPPMPAMPAMPPSARYDYDYDDSHARWQMEQARARLQELRPQLERIAPQVRMELDRVRPQIERLRTELPRSISPAIAKTSAM